MEIHYIFADGCLDCLRMETALLQYIKGSTHTLVRLNAEDDKAIDYAVDNDIDDIPACKIGDVVIQGKNFLSTDIKKAIEQLT